MKSVLPKDLAALIRKHGEAGKSALRKGFVSGGLKAVAELQRRTAEDGVFDRGGFRRGWRHSLSSVGLRIFNDAPYAPVVEDGRRPGARMPPRDVIERWAQRKLGLDAEDARAAAFPIARAIAARGIEGRHILERAVPAIERIVLGEVHREVDRALKGAK